MICIILLLMSKVFFVLMAYFLGAVPIGLLIARRHGHPDIRKEGSGNIGATNVARVVGKKAGIITLIGDILKGALPVLLAMWLMGTNTLEKQFWTALVGLASFLGHIFPIYLKFRGGKGIATATGVFFVLCPLAILFNLFIFLFVVWQFRYVSLGSLSAAAAMPPLLFILSDKKIYAILSIFIAIIIFYRHRDNIRRLLRGEENRL